AVSVMSATSMASAQSGGRGGWMTQGAEILPMGKHAFEARVGWPSTNLGVHIPVMSKLEVTPFLTMDYLGYAVRNWVGTFGDTFGVQLKGNLWQQGQHAISLGADLGIAMNYIGVFDAAFQIGGPELKYSYRWNNPRIAVIAGFRMPIRVWFRAECADIPMLFNAGFEYNVIPNLNIHANLEFGPYVLATAAGAIADGSVGFQFGISYLW
ncbi:MAG TPA: hypothetical protein PKH54_06380, partial [Myxococcota bacterium]|nr:hypothetical protein [Myxococcota bacterium]